MAGVTFIPTASPTSAVHVQRHLEAVERAQTSTVSGKGASILGLENTGGLLTAATVEAAVAELAPYKMVDVVLAHTVAVPVTQSASFSITTTAPETKALAIPTFVGQRLVFNCNAYAGGNRVITSASAINVAGNTIMTFGAVRDYIELVAIRLAGVLACEVVMNNNVALS